MVIDDMLLAGGGVGRQKARLAACVVAAWQGVEAVTCDMRQTI